MADSNTTRIKMKAAGWRRVEIWLSPSVVQNVVYKAKSQGMSVSLYLETQVEKMFG